RHRRTTSPPPPPTPLHRSATTHGGPPAARYPSGHLSRSAPPHAPGTTSASTSPPLADAASPSRTIAALLLPAPRSLLHLPAQLSSRSRTAAPPHRTPAAAMIPSAAPSGARRWSAAAPTSSGATTYHAPRT